MVTSTLTKSPIFALVGISKTFIFTPFLFFSSLIGSELEGVDVIIPSNFLLFIIIFASFLNLDSEYQLIHNIP